MITPLIIEIKPAVFEVNLIIIGKVVSIEVAPPDAIGNKWFFFEMRGVMIIVRVSLNMFDRNAIVPRLVPTIWVKIMLEMV